MAEAKRASSDRRTRRDAPLTWSDALERIVSVSRNS